jgi:pimeloyl-ACP methyl ester carboxylesterase
MARLLTTAPSRAGQLAELDVPTLVLVGEHDLLLREPSEQLAAAVPGARLVVVPGAGHSPQIEAPEVWFAAVSTFLADAGGQVTSAPSPGTARGPRSRG